MQKSPLHCFPNHKIKIGEIKNKEDASHEWERVFASNSLLPNLWTLRKYTNGSLGGIKVCCFTISSLKIEKFEK